MSANSDSNESIPELFIKNITDVDNKIDALCCAETASDIKKLLHIFDYVLVINERNIEDIFNIIKQYKHGYKYIIKFIKYARSIRPKNVDFLNQLLSMISDKLGCDISDKKKKTQENAIRFCRKETNEEKKNFERVIFNDDIDALLKLMEKTGFDLNTKIIKNEKIFKQIEGKPSQADCNVSFMNLIIYYGSIKCFKYALMDGYTNFEKSNKYAVAGGNTEIIHLLEQEGVEFNDCFNVSLIFHRNAISDWLIRNYQCNIYESNYIIHYFNIRSLFFSFQNEYNKMLLYNEIYSTFVLRKNIYELIKFFVEEKNGLFFDVEDASCEIKEIIKRRSTLHRACEEGNLLLVKKLAKEDKHFCVEQKYNCMTPLCYAVKNNNLEIVKYLVEECKANVETLIFCEGHKLTVLYIAIENGLLDITKYLIEECNANINGYSRELLDTAICFASSKNQLEIVKYLAKSFQFSQNDINKSLFNASSNNNLEVVKYLVEECNADIEFTIRKKTPLEIACMCSNFEVTQYLFEKCHANTSKISGNAIINALESNRMDYAIYLIEKLHLITNNVLCETCKLQNLEFIKYLVNVVHINVDQLHNNETALHIACSLQNMEMVKFLVNEGHANVEIKNYESETALHIACESGNMEIVKFLCKEAHANVEAEDFEYKTVFIRACFRGSMELMKYLIEEMHARIYIKKDNKVIYSAVDIAYLNRDTEFIKYLIKERLEDVKNIIDEYNYGGEMLLHNACQEERLDLVKCLIEDVYGKADVKNKYYVTPLHIFCLNGNFEFCKYLIEQCKADIHIKDDIGHNAFLCACCSGNLDLIKYLVDNYDIDPKEKNNFDETALHLASRKGSLEVFKYLIDKCKLNVNDKNIDNTSVLQYVCGGGNLEVTKSLIEEYHAETDVKNKNGYTLIYYAISGNSNDIIDYLIEKLHLDVNEVHKIQKQKYTAFK